MSGTSKIIQDKFNIIKSYLSNDKIDSLKNIRPILSVLIILFTLFISITIYYVSTNNNILNTQIYIYILISFLPLFLLSIVYSYIFKKKFNIFNALIILSIFTIFVIIMYFYNTILNFFKTYDFFFNILILLVFFSIILFGLSIAFKMFERKIKNLTGFLGFIVDFIFLLPCLLIDFVEYIKYQFNITPSITFILFIIEILLILLYVYIPYLFNAKIKGTGKQLLADTLTLNTKTDIAKTNDLEPINLYTEPPHKIDINTENITASQIRQNYSLSMWIYLNEQSQMYTEKTIFNYGASHPKISFANNSKDQNKEYVNISVNSDPKSTYKFEMPRQKWNHVVISYNNSSTDIFINGTLERTIYFNGKTPEYSITDLVSVGDNEGLLGAICNIEYYKKPLTQFQISTKYNLLMKKNPPVN